MFPLSVYIHTHTSMYLHTYIYIHLYIHIYVCVYVYVRVYVWIYMYICVYISCMCMPPHPEYEFERRFFYSIHSTLCMKPMHESKYGPWNADCISLLHTYVSEVGPFKKHLRQRRRHEPRTRAERTSAVNVYVCVCLCMCVLWLAAVGLLVCGWPKLSYYKEPTIKSRTTKKERSNAGLFPAGSLHVFICRPMGKTLKTVTCWLNERSAHFKCSVLRLQRSVLLVRGAHSNSIEMDVISAAAVSVTGSLHQWFSASDAASWRKLWRSPVIFRT